MPGLYDNEAGVHIEEENMMKGDWYKDPDTDALYIVPNDKFGQGETIGPDDGIVERLNVYYRNESVGTADTDLICDVLDLDFIPDVLRRFDPEIGYYTA